MPTIIASWGGATSNSYVDYTFANSYMSTKIDASAWTDASTPQREASLLEATRVLDARNWRGEKFYWDQRLEFPRTTYRERDLAGDQHLSGSSLVGTPWDVEYVWMQERVQQATCEQALWMLEQSESETFRLQQRGITSFSESIGKISESYSFGGPQSRFPHFSPSTKRLLSWYWAAPRIVRS